jgi:hypothetical protein
MPSIMDAFADLRDPRCRTCRYPLPEILFAALSAVLCGVEDGETSTLWARTQLAWLRTHLPYENGIASPDTFARVFGALSVKAFEQCFINWVSQLCPALEGQHIAIDGKAVRGSRSATHSALHLVSAWCSDTGLSLGQVSTSEKSNEITAIPELLAALNLEGATVTIDAMGTQHAIAEAIVKAGANYVLAVKDNQPGRAGPRACGDGSPPRRTAGWRVRTGNMSNTTRATGGWKHGCAAWLMTSRGWRVPGSTGLALSAWSCSSVPVSKVARRAPRAAITSARKQ